MVDGVIGEDTEHVARAAGQAIKQKHEHAQILLQLLVEMNAKEIRLTQGSVTLTHVLCFKIREKIAGVIAIRNRDLARGVERRVCAAQQEVAGKTQPWDVMVHLVVP
jgi:hypothetical protein